MNGTDSSNGDYSLNGADYPTDPSPGPLTRLALESVARISPNLAYIRPLRNALLNRLRNQIHSGRLQPPPVPMPPGVRDDRMIMGLALIDTFERALDENQISRVSLHKGASYMIESWLWGKGDSATMQRFRAEYGTLPPNFLVISPGKGCNLQCIGCYADSGPTPEKMEKAATEITTNNGAEWILDIAKSDLAPENLSGIRKNQLSHMAGQREYFIVEVRSHDRHRSLIQPFRQVNGRLLVYAEESQDATNESWMSALKMCKGDSSSVDFDL